MELQRCTILTYSPYVSWTIGGAGRYPAAGGAPLALCTPLPLEDGARLGGAPLGAAPRGTAACRGGTPPRLLTHKTQTSSPGLDGRAESLTHSFLFLSYSVNNWREKQACIHSLDASDNIQYILFLHAHMIKH